MDTLFMEHFTSMHFHYLIEIPSIIAIFGIFIISWGEICEFEFNNIGVLILAVIVLLLLCARVGEIKDQAPYLQKIIHDTNKIDEHIKEI